MIEEWKYIKDFEDYMISNFGRVMSLNFNHNRYAKLLKPNLSPSGYYRVTLFNDKIRISKNIHLLVWDHFGDKPRNGRKLQVDHIDDNRLNNRFDNLQLLTDRENISKMHLSKGTKTSRYLGVHYFKRDDKWLAKITINNKSHHLGLFDKEEDARDAYLNALNNIA